MADEVAAGEALLAAGDARGALAHVRQCLAWPRGRDVTELPPWLRLLRDVSAALSLDELVEIADDAVRDPDSPDKLYDLGYALIDAHAPSIAASILWHCLKLVGESEEVVCELVSALESALAYGDAYMILEQHAALRSRSFLCEYLFAFNAAMSGRLDTTRAVYARLVPDSPEMESMLGTIKGIVDRGDRIEPRDERDLRGWQYVLTGTLLAHQSPYGFDEPMHGRYAWLQDSLARIKTGLDRVVPLARAIAAPCVYALPGRASEIVAGALATLLDVPLAPWPSIGIPEGVIVAYDLAEIPGDALGRLSQRKADQLFFAHASPWTRDGAVAPDVTTLLYESIVEPVDEGTAEEVAAAIVASPGLDEAERAHDEPQRWELLARTAWPALPGQRSRFWAGGPVPSNRFNAP
jgi:hypothetical protein